jgi:glucosyl-3-phosphoglycerate synthase
MSDFTQNGVICTLPRLNESHLEPLDTLLLPRLTGTSPVSLILPCHAPDLDRPALEHICSQLADARWLTRVLVPVNGLPLARIPALSRRLSAQLPCKLTVFSTDEPALRAVLCAAADRSAAALPATQTPPLLSHTSLCRRFSLPLTLNQTKSSPLHP